MRWDLADGTMTVLEGVPDDVADGTAQGWSVTAGGDSREPVRVSPEACRQLASSARRRVRDSRAPATPPAQRAGIVRDFKQAWEAKDIDGLIRLLDPGATAVVDGGGLVSTVLGPIEGAERIARYALEILGRVPGMSILERPVNGEPGLVAQQNAITVTVMAFDIADGRIKQIWGVRNPDKLRLWTPA